MKTVAKSKDVATEATNLKPKYQRIRLFKRFEHFVLIPDSLSWRPNISPGAKLLYGKYSEYEGKESVSRQSVSELALDLGVSKRSIKYWTAELVKLGLIEVVLRRGQHCPSVIHFLDHPWLSEERTKTLKKHVRTTMWDKVPSGANNAQDKGKDCPTNDSEVQTLPRPKGKDCPLDEEVQKEVHEKQEALSKRSAHQFCERDQKISVQKGEEQQQLTHQFELPETQFTNLVGVSPGASAPVEPQEPQTDPTPCSDPKDRFEARMEGNRKLLAIWKAGGSDGIDPSLSELNDLRKALGGYEVTEQVIRWLVCPEWKERLASIKCKGMAVLNIQAILNWDWTHQLMIKASKQPIVENPYDPRSKAFQAEARSYLAEYGEVKFLNQYGKELHAEYCGVTE
jgi:DNA-binding transcriptional ArsR family regulator